MQISCKCAHCGHQYLSQSDDDICLEFDFALEEVRFICRNKGCKKQNVINFEPHRKTAPLPTPIMMR